jgi:hypothetical protein
MRVGASGRSAGLALLVAGLAIGGALTFTLSYVYGVLTPRTETTTVTVNSIVIITVPTVITSTNSGYVQVDANVTSCQWSGSHEFCEVTLHNVGTLDTATSGNCSLNYGSYTFNGFTGPTRLSAASPGAPQQLIPGGTTTSYCQASAGEAAGAGVQVTGSIFLADGADALFTGTASS